MRRIGTQGRILLSEAGSELQRQRKRNQGHRQEYQRDVQRHLSEVQMMFKAGKLRVEKKLEF